MEMPFSVRTVKSDLLSTLPVSTMNILKNGQKNGFKRHYKKSLYKAQAV